METLPRTLMYPLSGEQPSTASLTKLSLGLARRAMAPGEDLMQTSLWTTARLPVLSVELMRHLLPTWSMYDSARYTYTVQQGTVTRQPKKGKRGSAGTWTWREILQHSDFNSLAVLHFKGAPEPPLVSTEAYCYNKSLTTFHANVAQDVLKKAGLANPSITQPRSARAVLLPADPRQVRLGQIGLSAPLYDGLRLCLQEVDDYIVAYRQPVINPWSVTLYKAVRIDGPGHAIHLPIFYTKKMGADYDGDEGNCYVPRPDELDQFKKLALERQYKTPLGWSIHFVHSITEKFPPQEHLPPWARGLQSWAAVRTRAYYYFPTAREAMEKLQEILDLALQLPAPAYRPMTEVLGPEKMSIWNRVRNCTETSSWLESAMADNANLCAVQRETPRAGMLEDAIKSCMEQLRVTENGVQAGSHVVCPAFPLPHEVVEIPGPDGRVLRVSADPSHLPDLSVTKECEVPWTSESQWCKDHAAAQEMYPDKNIWTHFRRGFPEIGRRVGCDASSLTARITQMMLDIKHNTRRGGATALANGDIGKLVNCSPAPIVVRANIQDYEEAFAWCDYDENSETYTFSVRGRKPTALLLDRLEERIRARPDPLPNHCFRRCANLTLVVSEEQLELDDRERYMLAVRARELHGAPLGIRQCCRGSTTFFLHRVAPREYCVMRYIAPDMLVLPPQYVPVVCAPSSSQLPIVWEQLITGCDIVSPLTLVARREGIRSCERKLRRHLLRCFSTDKSSWNQFKPHCYLMARLMCLTGKLVPLTKVAQARLDLYGDTCHSSFVPRNLDHLLQCAVRGEQKHGNRPSSDDAPDAEPTGDRTRLALGYAENTGTLEEQQNNYCHTLLDACNYAEVYFDCDVPPAPLINDPYGSSLPLDQKVVTNYWGLAVNQKQGAFLKHHFHDFEEMEGACTSCHQQGTLRRKITQRRSADETAHVVVVCSGCFAAQ